MWSLQETNITRLEQKSSKDGKLELNDAVAESSSAMDIQNAGIGLRIEDGPDDDDDDDDSEDAEKAEDAPQACLAVYISLNFHGLNSCKIVSLTRPRFANSTYRGASGDRSLGSVGGSFLIPILMSMQPIFSFHLSSSFFSPLFSPLAAHAHAHAHHVHAHANAHAHAPAHVPGRTQTGQTRKKNFVISPGIRLRMATPSPCSHPTHFLQSISRLGRSRFTHPNSNISHFWFYQALKASSRLAKPLHKSLIRPVMSL